MSELESASILVSTQSNTIESLLDVLSYETGQSAGMGQWEKFHDLLNSTLQGFNPQFQEDLNGFRDYSTNNLEPLELETNEIKSKIVNFQQTQSF